MLNTYLHTYSHANTYTYLAAYPGTSLIIMQINQLYIDESRGILGTSLGSYEDCRLVDSPIFIAPARRHNHNR